MDLAPEDDPLDPFEEKVFGQSWATRLLIAAERGTLSTSQTGRAAEQILQELLDDTEYHGFPPQLIPLICLHRAAFSPPAQALLTELAEAMCAQKRPIRARRFFFDPEEYLHALVTLRLLADEDIEQDFEDAAQEWLFHEWGWGAHLSDSATQSLLIDLSLLLLLDKTPPRLTETLIARLLRVEESFAGIPRIPTTRRSSDFGDRSTFRDEVLVATVSNPVAFILQRLGWESRVPAPAPARKQIATPCFGGAVAHTYQSERGTLGTLSKFPLAPAGDWRLTMHSSPVAFRKPEGESPHPGLRSQLQWRLTVREGEKCVYWAELPGGGMQALGTFPETWSLQRGGEVLVLRLYRMRPGFRLEVEDWWSTDATRMGGPVPPENQERYQQSLAKIQAAQPGVRVWPLAEVLEQEPQRVKSLCPVVNLWAISLDGEIVAEPTVTPARVIPSVPRRRGEEAWDIDWVLPGGLWKVRVDPLAKEPLCGR